METGVAVKSEARRERKDGRKEGGDEAAAGLMEGAGGRVMRQRKPGGLQQCEPACAAGALSAATTERPRLNKVVQGPLV